MNAPPAPTEPLLLFAPAELLLLFAPADDFFGPLFFELLDVAFLAT
jgi:hypothetical protein